MDQFAAYFGYAVAGLTIVDKILAAAKQWAASTPSTDDDVVVGKVEAVVNVLHGVVGQFAILRGAKK